MVLYTLHNELFVKIFMYAVYLCKFGDHAIVRVGKACALSVRLRQPVLPLGLLPQV